MDTKTFKDSLDAQAPPDGLRPTLQALWYEAQGDWERAHTLVQDDAGGEGARIHAYLHRKEGDLSNASYWYRRAGVPPADGPLETEWEALVQELLGA